MAHDDEFELAHADFSRHPGTPGMPLEHPLPSYSEDDEDAVTLAMRPLEEQLAQPGPELTWGRDFGRGDFARGKFAPANAAPAVVLPTPGVVQPAPVALPAPPVARAPSVRPPAVSQVVAPPLAVAHQAAPAVRAPMVSAYEPAPSPPPPAARVERAPSPRPPPFRAELAQSAMAPSVRPVTSASAPTISVRTRPAVFAQALAQAAAAQPRAAARKSRGDLLLLAFATACAALVVMSMTGAVLYRIGAFKPGSASPAAAVSAH